MIHETTGRESRASERRTTARPAIWAFAGSSETRIGWMLESSETGCAFAWRGAGTPVEGEVISVCVGASCDPSEMTRALVKRVKTVHDDLSIIAVRLLPAPRPLVSVAAAEVKPICPKPRRTIASGV